MALSTFFFIKRPITEKQKHTFTKANIFLGNIMLNILLVKCEFDEWFHFFQKQGNAKKIRFP